MPIKHGELQTVLLLAISPTMVDSTTETAGEILAAITFTYSEADVRCPGVLNLWLSIDD